MQLTPVGGDRFVVAGTPIVAEFIPASAGHPQEVRVTGAGKPRVSELVSPFSPSSLELQAFEVSIGVRRWKVRTRLLQGMAGWCYTFRGGRMSSSSRSSKMGSPVRCLV